MAKEKQSEENLGLPTSGSEEFQKLVSAKISAGLTKDQAEAVAATQIKHDVKLAEEAKAKK